MRIKLIIIIIIAYTLGPHSNYSALVNWKLSYNLKIYQLRSEQIKLNTLVRYCECTVRELVTMTFKIGEFFTLFKIRRFGVDLQCYVKLGYY